MGWVPFCGDLWAVFSAIDKEDAVSGIRQALISKDGSADKMQRSCLMSWMAETPQVGSVATQFKSVTPVGRGQR